MTAWAGFWKSGDRMACVLLTLAWGAPPSHGESAVSLIFGGVQLKNRRLQRFTRLARLGERDDCFVPVMGYRHVDNNGCDRGKESTAGHDRAKAEAAILGRLGHEVAKRGTQRPCQDIDQPKAENWIQTQEEITDAQRDDDHSEQHTGGQVS